MAENQFEGANILFFEIGQIFHKSAEKKLPNECRQLCIGIKNDLGEEENFDLIKGIFERILKEFKIKEEDFDQDIWKIELVPQSIMEYFGLKKKVALLTINLDKFQKAIPSKNVFLPISKYPYVERDISVIFEKKIAAKNILGVIKNANPLILQATIIDIYEGKPFANNEKSVTVRITLSSFNKTLTDLEIANTVSVCIKNIISLGGKIRVGEK